ncbi:MAG: hypothetical protein JRC67_08190 [Deltaproteobacteria bacterium]|jgi:hypothetical protein|nr:hypothetical protein [Deltaproteobacteria bacterium]
MKARAKAAANPSEDMMGQVRDHSGLQKLQKIMKRVEDQLNKWRGSCMRQG